MKVLISSGCLMMRIFTIDKQFLMMVGSSEVDRFWERNEQTDYCLISVIVRVGRSSFRQRMRWKYNCSYFVAKREKIIVFTLGSRMKVFFIFRRKHKMIGIILVIWGDFLCSKVASRLRNLVLNKFEQRIFRKVEHCPTRDIISKTR